MALFALGRTVGRCELQLVISMENIELGCVRTSKRGATGGVVGCLQRCVGGFQGRLRRNARESVV